MQDFSQLSVVDKEDYSKKDYKNIEIEKENIVNVNNRIETSKKNLESNFNPNEVKENVETFNNSSSNSDFVDRQKTNIENRANKFEGNKLNSNEIKDKYIFDTEDTSRGKIFDDFSSLKNIDFKVIGQVFDTFILVERNGLLEIYDQHIIHERILYEKLKQEYYNHSMSKQNLLVPIRFELDPREKQLALENIEIFSSFGFDIDDFDKNEILLRSIPTMNLRDSYENIFREILDNISKNKDKDIRENIIVSMSCKGAIKANHKLTLEEMYSMVAKLHEVGEYTCPHGRPIIVKMSLLDLEKLFKRK